MNLIYISYRFFGGGGRVDKRHEREDLFGLLLLSWPFVCSSLILMIPARPKSATTIVMP